MTDFSFVWNGVVLGSIYIVDYCWRVVDSSTFPLCDERFVVCVVSSSSSSDGRLYNSRPSSFTQVVLFLLAPL